MLLKEIEEISLRTIREEFHHSGIDIIKIILFGSRARGEAGPQSDWDYLVCVKETLSFQAKNKIISRIQTRLAEIHISVDIIVKSEDALQKEQTNVGFVTYYALKDGVSV